MGRAKLASTRPITSEMMATVELVVVAVEVVVFPTGNTHRYARRPNAGREHMREQVKTVLEATGRRNTM